MNPQHSNLRTGDEIYEELCQKIEKLEYMPGSKLSENELCKIYDTTRHVVRSALAQLKQQKLVDVFPQRGTFVSLIDMDYIGDILYMREAAEQEALARIIEMEDASHIVDLLRNTLDEQKNLGQGSHYNTEFQELDNRFHHTLMEAVQKPNVMNLIEEPYVHIRRWRNYEVRSEKRIQEILKEHEAIIEAIEARDRAKGRECLHCHLDTVNRYSKPLKEMEAQYFV
jgi:DNA-binding GntR family transcriptional regulator